MATDASFMAYVVDQAALGPALTTRRMFGEYALYVHGKVVGFVCDNQVLVKDLDETRLATAAMPVRPVYPGGKDYPVADALLDEHGALGRLLLAIAEALPPPKPKPPRKSRPGSVPPRPSGKLRQ